MENGWCWQDFLQLWKIVCHLKNKVKEVDGIIMKVLAYVQSTWTMSSKTRIIARVAWLLVRPHVHDQHIIILALILNTWGNIRNPATVTWKLREKRERKESGNHTESSGILFEKNCLLNVKRCPSSISCVAAISIFSKPPVDTFDGRIIVDCNVAAFRSRTIEYYRHHWL